MKYFYEYKYNNGCTVGGHNLENVEFYDNYTKLIGVEDNEVGYWGSLLDMREIEFLKIIPMTDSEEEIYKGDE